MSNPWTPEERRAWLALDAAIGTALDHERGADDRLEVVEPELAAAFDGLDPGGADPKIVEALLGDSQEMLIALHLSERREGESGREV